MIKGFGASAVELVLFICVGVIVGSIALYASYHAVPARKSAADENRMDPLHCETFKSVCGNWLELDANPDYIKSKYDECIVEYSRRCA